MEDTTMTKKVIDFNRLPKQEYMKPAMEVIEADMDTEILVGSVDAYGMNKSVIEGEEVGQGW